MKKYLGVWAIAALFGLTACPGGPTESIVQDDQGLSNDSLLEQADTARVPASLDPRNADALELDAVFDQVEKHLEDKNYAYAREYLRRAAMRDSLNSRYLNLQARLYLLANQSKKAHDLWRKCMEKYPGDLDCRISMAELQLTLGLNRDALQTANAIIALDRNRAEGFFLKGMAIRAVNGDTTASIPYFQQAVDLRNNYVEALDMLGVIYAQRKDTLALAYYKNVLELQPDRSDVYYKIGVLHMQRKEWNKAMGAYERAIQLNPRDADSYYNLGYILTQLQVYDKARNNFSKAINVSQRNFKAYYGRGYSHEMLGDLTNASRDYREALSIRPNHAPSAEALARVKKKMEA